MSKLNMAERDAEEIAEERAERKVKCFGWRLKAAAQFQGMNGRDLAERLNVSPRTISNWVRGDCEPGLWNLRELAVVLRVTVEALLGLEPLMVELRQPGEDDRKAYEE